MTDTQIAQQVDSQVLKGIRQLEQGRRGTALFTWWRALDLCHDIKSPDTRWTQLQRQVEFFGRAGIDAPYLQMMAIEDAVDLDRQEKQPDREGEDLLVLGRIHMMLNNFRASARASQQAIEILMMADRYGSAAAASTNFALMLGQIGRMDDAIEQLQKSLVYLKKGPSSDTEMRTRMLLINSVDQANADPQIAVTAGACLKDCFGDAIWGDMEEMWADPLRRSIDRYLALHKEIDQKAWLESKFSWLDGRGATN